MKIAVSSLGIKSNSDMLKVNDLNCDYLHLDIMDGKFVNNKTEDYEIIVKRLEGLNKKIDIHLMVNDIKKYVDIYKCLKPSYVTFHYEAGNDIEKMIDYIHSLNVKVGISINPNTEINNIKRYLNLVDLVLIMSVEPGKGGQIFINKTVDKIRKLKELKVNNNYHYIIEVDGGINDETAHLCADADMLVIGSFITNYNNYSEQLEKIKI